MYMYRGVRKERRDRNRIQRDVEFYQSSWFFFVPAVKLRYTGSPFYVPIRRTMMNTMDIYNEKMNNVRAGSGHRTRVFRLRGKPCNRSTTAAPRDTEREGGRGREGETQRERERETERQRETEGETEREREGQGETQREGEGRRDSEMQ